MSTGMESTAGPDAVSQWGNLFGETNGAPSMPNGVSSMPNGVSSMPNGASGVTNGASQTAAETTAETAAEDTVAETTAETIGEEVVVGAGAEEGAGLLATILAPEVVIPIVVVGGLIALGAYLLSDDAPSPPVMEEPCPSQPAQLPGSPDHDGDLSLPGGAPPGEAQLPGAQQGEAQFPGDQPQGEPLSAASPVTPEENKALNDLGPLSGKNKADIESQLTNQGYTKTPSFGGGDVWTKDLGNGKTIAVRIDPPKIRTPPLGYADEVPHAHKESVPTSEVSNGNYSPRARGKNTFDDQGNPSTSPVDTHIPIQP